MAVLRQLALHPPRQGRPPQLGRAGQEADPGSAAGAGLMPLLVLVLLLQTVTAQPLLVMPVTVQRQVLGVMQVWLLILGCSSLCEQQKTIFIVSRLLGFVTLYSHAAICNVSKL